MKKIIVSVFAGMCFLAISVPGYADSLDYETKLKEGFGTMAQSPMSLVDSVKEEYNASKFKPFGVFGGLLKGSFYTLKEFSTGVYQVLTFNVDEDNFFSGMMHKEAVSE